MLKNSLDQLKSTCSGNKKFKAEFIQYAQRIVDEPRIRGALTEDAEQIIHYVNDETELSGAEILSLIYAERNMYYHNGETAKMGMGYQNRLKVLKVYTKTLIQNTLYIINHVLEQQIAASRG